MWRDTTLIIIGQPYKYVKEGKAYLKASIQISDDTVNEYSKLREKYRKVHWRTKEEYPPHEWSLAESGLWFSVDNQYAKYLCTETADAFVCAMLWYAMMTGSDIKSEAPVSEKMLFGINNHLIPALCTKERRRIKVSAPSSSFVYSLENGVATGMSCGIDSLYTLHQYLHTTPDSMNLTHLTYFNMGAIFHPDSSSKTKYSINEFYKKTDEMSEEKMLQALDVAKTVDLPLIYITSNLDKDYYRGAYGYTAVYRNCACVLAVQKLIHTYYCSSAGWPDYFDLSLSEGSEHYETLLCNTLSTESCTFIISDYVTRIEKTRAISDWSIAHKHLDVCFNFKNCGHCAKCYRTLLTLDLLGKVDQFNQVFNIDEYKGNRKAAYSWLLYTKEGDAKDDNAVFARDIYMLVLDNKVKIPISSFFSCVKHRIGKKIKIIRSAIKKHVRTIVQS